MKKIAVILFFLPLLTVPAVAQETIQVVTKTISRSLALGPEDSLRVDAEKATVRLRGWGRAEVKLVLRLTAKHPERAVAESDLAASQYQVTTKTAEKVIRNFFLIPEGTSRIKSNLQADYEMWVPHDRAVTLSNRYGNIALSDWQATLTIKTEFGELLLQKVTGDITFDVAYGDITAEEVAGTLRGTTRKSNLNLYELAGDLFLESSYGEINVTTKNKLQRLTINAARTKVNFATPDPMRYSYQLATSCDNISTPVPGKYEDKNRLDCKKSFTSYHTDLPPIFVKTSFSPININSLTYETNQRAHRP